MKKFLLLYFMALLVFGIFASNGFSGTVTDIDGNIYQTVKIGDQWWMAENLKVTHYRNGDPIPNATDDASWVNLTTGAYCEYDNDIANVATYGRLYNWFVVDDSRNVAPEGWHIPSDAEWKQLEMYLGMSQAEADNVDWRGTNEGGKLKEVGTSHWQSPNEGATNESGFSALPGGYRSIGGYFHYIEQGGYFWSSTTYDADLAWYRALFSIYSTTYRISPNHEYGFSVRLIRDDINDHLIGYWNFDDGTATDNSGNGNDGTVYDATPTTGITGQGFQFDGVDDFIEISDNEMLDINDDITLSAWIYLESEKVVSTILAKGDLETNFAYYMATGLNYDNGSSSFQVANQADDRRGVRSPSALNTHQWYHLVGIRNGTTLTTYVNGIPVNTSDCFTDGLRINNLNLLLGWYHSDYYFHGIIDEIRIYDIALSDNEVLSLYHQDALPHIQVTTSELNFEAAIGGEFPEPQTISITNTGGGILDWYVDEQIDWLDLDVWQGTSNEARITVSINSIDMEPESYNGTMTVASTNADNSPQTIDVTYNITPSFGTTVIIHGLAFGAGNEDNFETEATWVLPMADAIIERLGSGRIFRIEHGFRQGSILPLEQVEPGEQVIAFSWIPESFKHTKGFAEGAADALFAQLVQGALVGLWDLNQLHFIAHSRGTVVAAETIQRLGLYESELESLTEIDDVDHEIHLTTLDSHPWDRIEEESCIADPFSADDESVNDGLEGLTVLSEQHSKAILPWSNIGYLDNYYQERCRWNDFYALNGLSFNQIYGLNPAGNVYLDAEILDVASSDNSNHNKVHSWYYGTIDINCSPLCDDGGGIIFDPSIFYIEVGPTGPRNEVGFNRGRNFNWSGDNDLIPMNQTTISEDHSLYYGSIFNGDFTKSEAIISPGWCFQGGEGDLPLFESRFRLDRFRPKIVHNWMYIPSNVTDIFISYQLINSDDENLLDCLKVYLDDGDPLETECVHSDNPVGILPVSIESTIYPGTVRKLTIQLENNDGNDIDACLAINNVYYVLNDQVTFEELLEMFVRSPIDLKITDPDGFWLDKETSLIPDTKYEYYVINEADTGVYIKIPQRKEGLYDVEVIPRESANPGDVYSIYAFSNNVLDTLAIEVDVADIPDIGYQHCGSTEGCEYVCGDVNSDTNIDILDIVFTINYKYKGGPEPRPLFSGDVNSDESINILDVVYLINYKYKSGPEPNCP